MNKKNDQKNTQFKNNIEIKIDAKSGKASGNLFKRNPVVSNNPSLKVGQKLSGKVDFSSIKKKLTRNKIS